MLTIQELEARLRLLREYGAKSFHDGDVEIELHATPEPTPAPERRTTVAVPPSAALRANLTNKRLSPVLSSVKPCAIITIGDK